MSREKALAKNTIILMLGKICTQCVNFFMLPLYTTILSTEEYGTADLILTVVSLLLPVVSLQLDQGLFRYLLDNRAEENSVKQLFSSTVFVNVCQIFVFEGIAIVIGLFVSSNYWKYILVLLPVQILQSTLLQFSRGINRTGCYAVASFITALVQVLCNILFIAILRIGLSGLLYSMIVSSVVGCAYIAISLEIWKYFSVSTIRLLSIRNPILYSLPLIPNQLAWWVINTSDRVVVSFFLGVAQNGIYTVACKFSTLYITFYNYFNMSWTESVSLAINDDDNEYYVNSMINAFFNLILCAALGIIAIMPFAFHVLVGEGYYESYNQIPILILAVFFQALQGLYSAIYVALKKTKEIAKTSLISSVINISVDLLLIRYIGLYAASMSTLVAFFSMAIYRYFDIQKYLKIHINKKSILAGVFETVVVICAYYSRNALVELTVFVLICISSIYLNKRMVATIINTIKRSINHNDWKRS